MGDLFLLLPPPTHTHAHVPPQMYRLRHPWAFTLEGDVRPVVELLLGVPGLDVRALLPRVPQILGEAGGWVGG